MSYRYHGKARVNPSRPQAFAVCDSCGFWFNHVDLRWQYQYAGLSLQNLRLLKCPKCMDTPQVQLQPVILPPDPTPIQNARPESYAQDETGTTQELFVQIQTSESALTSFYLDLFNDGASVLEDITGSATRTDFATSMAAVVGDYSQNTAIITFTDSCLASTIVDQVKVYDASTGGNLLMTGTLPEPITAVLYNGLAFPIGNLQVQFNVTP